ncbi:MAG: hypothetical protein HYU99_05030 [Deltaproteobacteria bacterium]|nr:hypothetical protein [Deltaproteobacteria bacterium]
MSNGDLPIAKPGVPPETAAPAESKVEERKKEEAARQEPLRPDQFKDALKDEILRAHRMVQTPPELGKKYDRSFRPPVREGPRPDATRQAPRHKPPPEPQNYRRLLQEAVFRPLRQSPLHQRMEQRSLSPRQGDPLNRQELSRLIQLRQQTADRANMRRVIRHEIDLHRRHESSSRKGLRADMPRGAGEATAPLLQRAGQFLNRLSRGPAETPFEKILQKILQGGRVVPEQSAGKSVVSAKNQAGWKTFFANALKLGSKETSITKNLSELAEAMFRGTYQSASGQKGLILVSDLRFLLGDKVVSDKFARLMVDHPDLLARLAQMSPGDPIPAELLALLGADINYLQLTHLAEGMSTEARAAAREAALQQLRSPSNPQTLGRFEQMLLKGRSAEEERQRKRLTEGTPWTGGWSALGGWPGYDPRQEREKRPGRPRFWTFFVYSIGTILAIIAGYVVFRAIF